jgi:hypothetical protein
MAEILIKACDATHPDPDKDRIGCYKVGMPVVVMPDGHGWGAKELPPLFYLIKVPGVSVDMVEPFVAPEYEALPDEDGNPIKYRRRKWQIQVTDLPQSIKNKFRDYGEITVQAGSYDGTYDYTWDQIKQYFRNLETGADGAEFV